MIDVPDGSIYFWMFSQGLKHTPIHDIENAVTRAGKIIRPKDEQNYWNGWYRSDLYLGRGRDDVLMLTGIQKSKSEEFFDTGYLDYPDHPYMWYPEIQNRWVPCSKDNKPLIKWGDGCMLLEDAVAHKNQVYLAENLKGCKFIVIDCDGDHDEQLDLETIMFLNDLRCKTHTLKKPKRVEEYEGYGNSGLTMPASFHLTFSVDRIIPTMHFPYAHIDIIGNRCNSLRYLKNKEWNGLQPAHMTSDIWRELQSYIRRRKEKDGTHSSIRN